jgi:hypothetical protein
LDEASARRKASTYTQNNTNTEYAHIDIHASSGILAHDPSVSAGEDGSCLRLRSHCDRQVHIYLAKIVSLHVKTSYRLWNYSNSGYSNYILNTGHTYGTRMDNTDIIKTGK